LDGDAHFGAILLFSVGRTSSVASKCEDRGVRMAAGSLLVLAGVALLGVAVLGAGSRLRRNRWVGVRTANSLSSQAAFTLANRVAAVPLGAAGLVAVGGGAVVLAGGPDAMPWIVLAVAVVGTLVLTGIGGALGDRAAARLTTVVAAPACTGTCAGCELVAGCRPQAVD
jgi:hypothetical protein